MNHAANSDRASMYPHHGCHTSFWELSVKMGVEDKLGASRNAFCISQDDLCRATLERWAGIALAVGDQRVRTGVRAIPPYYSARYRQKQSL